MTKTTKKKTVPQVIVTAHGFDRYIQRVHRGHPSEVSKKDVSFWATEAVLNGINLGKFHDGHTHYKFQGHTVVVSGDNKLVTINQYLVHLDEESEFGKVNREISAIIKKRLAKEVKPYERKKRELLIQTYESEISKLKVHNPDTQKIITKKINKLKTEIEKIDKKIEGIRSVGHNYQVEV